MFSKYKKTIKQEFFITSFLSVLIIAIIFITLFTTSIYYLSMNNARQKLKSANVHLSTYTEGVLDSLEMSTKINAAYPEVSKYKNGDQQARKNILDLFAATQEANQNIKFCYAGYENGDLLINDYTAPEGYDSRQRPWYTSAVASYPNCSVGLPYQEIKTNEWLVSVSKAVKNEQGQLVGVIAVDCSLSYVKALMADVVYYNSQTNFIVDSNGLIFVHPVSSYLHLSADQIVLGLNSLFKSDSGYIEYTLEGTPRMAYYKKMPLTNWVIISAIDTSEIMSPIVMNMFIIILFLLVLAVLLGSIQAKSYEKSLVKPILKLRDRIAEITVGKTVTETKYTYSNHELAEIATKIEEMAQSSLRKKTYELELILESTSDGILVIDLEGNVIHTNSKLSELWGISKEHLENNATEVLKEKMHSEDIHPLSESLGHQQRVLKLSSGIVLEQYSCELIDEGKVAGRLWSYRDITDKIKTEEELKKLATTDSLTGLWNRRYFMERGAFEMEQALLTKLPLALLFIDIDYFKRINDAYGHAVGDEALNHLAIALKSSLRSTDVIARLGGEEFSVLLPNTAQESAYMLAQNLRKHFENSSYYIHGYDLKFTISIGVAILDLHNNNNTTGIELLLNQADQACYQAKEKGRNLVMPCHNDLK